VHTGVILEPDARDIGAMRRLQALGSYIRRASLCDLCVRRRRWRRGNTHVHG
jgi:hypothetical protein